MQLCILKVFWVIFVGIVFGDDKCEYEVPTWMIGYDFNDPNSVSMIFSEYNVETMEIFCDLTFNDVEEVVSKIKNLPDRIKIRNYVRECGAAKEIRLPEMVTDKIDELKSVIKSIEGYIVGSNDDAISFAILRCDFIYIAKLDI